MSKHPIDTHFRAMGPYVVHLGSELNGRISTLENRINVLDTSSVSREEANRGLQDIPLELDYFFLDQAAERTQAFVNRIEQELGGELFQKLLQVQEERHHYFAMESQNCGIGQRDFHFESAHSDMPAQTQVPAIPGSNLQGATDITVAFLAGAGGVPHQGQTLQTNFPVRFVSAFAGPKAMVENTSPSLGTLHLSPIPVAAMQGAPIKLDPTFSFPTSHIPLGLILASDLSKVLQPKLD